MSIDQLTNRVATAQPPYNRLTSLIAFIRASRAEVRAWREADGPEALRVDHDLVFITAESDDWPVEFYRRLGFEHVEDRADFLLVKAETASGSS